jgi:translation initiation factor 5
MINITGLVKVDDPFYRYKMSKVKMEIQKNKTIISNLKTILTEIDRDINLLIKFFKKWFQTSIRDKDNIIIINKKLTINEINEGINHFIEYFVLCPYCRNPETMIEIKRRIKLVCKSCGYNGLINYKGISNKSILKYIDLLVSKKKMK